MVEGIKAMSEGVELLITTRHATCEAQRRGQLVRVAQGVETPVGMVGQEVLPALRHIYEKAARRLPRDLQNRWNTISPSTNFELNKTKLNRGSTVLLLKPRAYLSAVGQAQQLNTFDVRHQPAIIRDKPRSSSTFDHR